MEDMLTAAQADIASRPVFEYDLPEELTELGDKFVKKTLGYVKLRMREEIAANQAAGGNEIKLGMNMLIASLVEVDGRRIDKGSGEDEQVVNGCDPQIRQLMLTHFGDFSAPTQAMVKKSLASRRIKVG